MSAATEVEMKKKTRVDDALHATRAAIEEGIVAGGGVALVRAIKSLDNLKGANEDETIGVSIIRKSLETPIRVISENAGVDGSVVFQRVANAKDAMGYNARTNKYEDLKKAGVIDPTKVTRIALENAASIAGMVDDRLRHRPARKSRRWRTRPPRNGRHGRDDVISALTPNQLIFNCLEIKKASLRVRGEAFFFFKNLAGFKALET